jgi:hypothetical protein
VLDLEARIGLDEGEGGLGAARCVDKEFESPEVVVIHFTGETHGRRGQAVA